MIILKAKILDMDYSHGIIYTQLDTGNQIEEVWSGMYNGNCGDNEFFIYKYNDTCSQYKLFTL
jgi:hypothetical protein